MPRFRASENDPAIVRAIAEGRIVLGPAVQIPSPESERIVRPKKKPEMVQAGFERDGRRLVFTLPILTVSETNGREWQARSGRTQLARRIVSQVFGANLRELADIAECYHSGRPIRIGFARLGGHRLDTSNLPASLKGVEDAVAATLGASDGSPLWLPGFDQFPGGACGVRISLETADK